MKSQLTKAILFNFFAGHSSSMQKKMVEEWLSENENKELYFEWLEEWERKHPQYIANENEALSEFVSFIGQSQRIVSKQKLGIHKPNSSKRIAWIGYAAAICIGIALLFLIPQTRYKTYSTNFDQIKKIEMPDGSLVTLNRNSSIRFKRFGFGTDTREVFLQGEAEFSVKHKPSDQKFLVHTPDQLEVEVVGTKFIVISRKRGSKVILNEGKVLLRNLSDTVHKTISIKPGDVMTIVKGNFKLKEKQPVQTYSAWKEHRFIFDRTPLSEIALRMDESFGVKMHIADTLLANRELTGTFEAENAQELLDVLARVLDVSVSKDGRKVKVMAH
jgi:transmembrane sensor